MFDSCRQYQFLREGHPMEKERYVNDMDLEPNRCEWPKCKCAVPYYALSMHNRVHYCMKLTEAVKDGTLKARQDPI